ncbi:MAG: aldehyde dehydrogenase [Verrucomicrobia bacterium]|nr:MAG: aldehyde dehydrogenase [Verrucomicrobiota bacterium]
MSKNLAEILQRQRAFFDAGKTRNVAFRRERLGALQSALEAHEAELLKALHADLRKSPTEAYVTELAYLHAEIRHALRHVKSWMKPQRRRTPPLTWPSRAWTQPEPLGMVLILGPWNYPVQLLLVPLVGAIAAGNCAVLKPSEHAPATAKALQRMIGRTFAPEHVTLVQGGRETAEALLRERFDKIFFTGGATVGRAVMAAAARHLTPVTLELGGKSPCIVCADAPLQVAARRIVWGKFLNAGQTCVAPDFVWADQRIVQPLLEEIAHAIRAFYGEDPGQSPDYGRIINRAHFDRLCGYLRDGHVVIGGQHNAADLYMAPTVLTGTSLDSSVMQEEIFGPILPVLSFQSLEEVLAELHRRPTPLALYLFTRDRATQRRVLSGTRSGGVCLNDTVLHLTPKDLPFGGLDESGFGAYHGRASFDCFSHQRSVLRRGFLFDSRRRYPPQRLSLAALKRVMKWLMGT